MKKSVVAGLLATLLAVPCATPASADTRAVFRNVVLFGVAAAAALGITNIDHKKHLKAEEDEETDRRQASYKAYYYRTTGNYPTQEQIHQWYVKTYGTQPAD